MKKRLNFGCGLEIKKGWVNVDIQKGKGIDKSFDFSKYPYPFSDNMFDEILIDNVLEHLSDPQRVMRELWRISKPNAVVKIIVPYYNSYSAHSDPTHVNFFNEIAIKLTLGDIKYSNTNQKEKIEIVNLKSVPQRFFAWLPKSVLNVLKRFLGNIIVTLDVEARVIK